MKKLLIAIVLLFSAISFTTVVTPGATVFADEVVAPGVEEPAGPDGGDATPDNQDGATPAARAAAEEDAGSKCEPYFLTFPPWYRGLTEGDKCNLASPADMPGDDSGDQLTQYISVIVVNVLEILLQLVVYICVGFIIWGGYMYLISLGSSDRLNSGKSMIQNAVIGLVISMVAVIAVSFVAGRIGL